MADIKDKAMSNYLDNNLPKVILVDMYTPQINGARERMKQLAAELTADWEEEKRREEDSEEEDEDADEGKEDQDVNDEDGDGSTDGDEVRVSQDPDDDEGGGKDGNEGKEDQDAGDDEHEGEDEVEDEVMEEGVGGDVPVERKEPVVPNESPVVNFGLAEVGLLLGVVEVAHENGNGGDSSSVDEPLHKQATKTEFTIHKRKQNKAASGTSEFTPRKRTHKNPASESNLASETHTTSDTPRPKRTKKCWVYRTQLQMTQFYRIL